MATPQIPGGQCVQREECINTARIHRRPDRPPRPEITVPGHRLRLSIDEGQALSKALARCLQRGSQFSENQERPQPLGLLL
jgi:hypothetical protein